MRYEDTSGTLGSAGTPEARDDADKLVANSNAPATGNVITGAGTTTGKDGADTPQTGHVVSVRGAGGTDTSDSGQTLHVEGRYGTLSMDEHGNYRYVPEARHPNDVRDLFQYTLATAKGQSTADLVIELGGGAVKINANAQQIVPGPDGVVTLPAGVDLSDVHVVGRNLVVNLPDGSQIVIIDGAVFVPQLVVGGVELPSTNLAALLIDAEPKPAAGSSQSSGGNFEVPVPPLDPGQPLGDLIPPVEMHFQPPEFIPVGQFEDKTPEAGTASVQLDDDDVPGKGGNPGGPGDDAGSPNATASGFLPGSGGDGSLTWDLLNSGAPAGFSYVDGPNGSILVEQVQNGSTVIVLTITIDPDTGAYSVTENNPIMHPAGGDENNVAFVINYTVTDQDGDQAFGTLNVNVDDDTPTVSVQAGPDADVILTTDDAQTIGAASDTDQSTANFSGVFSGTTVSFGADGPGPGTSSTYALAVTGSNSGLFSHGDAINLYLVNGVVVGSTAASAGAIDAGNTIFTVETDNTGVVTLTQFQQIDHPIGQDPSATEAPFNDQFISMADGLVTLTRSETVVDGDGDQVTGSATINIGANLHFTDDGPTVDPSLNEVGAAVLDESPPSDTPAITLVGGYTAGDDPDLSGGLAIGKGSTTGPVIDANASFGADGPAAGGGISYSLDVLNSVSGLTTTDGTAIDLVKLSNGVVVGVVEGTTTAAFAISIDSTTGVVTVEQYLSLFHPDATNPDDVDLLNEGTLGVSVTATDFDGDTASAGPVDISHLIQFHDDGPSVTLNAVAEPSLTVDETNFGGDAGPTSFAGMFNFNFGADGPADSNSIQYNLGINAGSTGLVDTLSGLAVVLSVESGEVIGRAGVGGEIVFVISVDSDGNVSLDQQRAVVHADPNDPNDSITFLADNLITLSATVTDGDGDQATIGTPLAIAQDFHFLDDAPSVNPTLNANATVTVDESLPSDAATINTGAIVKGDDPDLAGGLAIGKSNSGGAIVDPHAVFGADGPAASNSISYALSITNVNSGVTLTDGTTITLQLVNGVIVGVVDSGTFAGEAAFAIAIDSSTGVVSVEQYLSLDHPDATDPNDALQLGNNTIAVTVTATDGDGDHVTSGAVDVSHQITFLDDGPTADPALADINGVTVDESPPSNAAGIDTGLIVKGDDPDLSGGLAIGQGSTSSAVLDPNAVFGADGPAAGGGISYSLSIISVSSGLTLTDGSAINLQQLANGNVVGVVASGAFAGQAAFAFHIDSTTGVVTVEQYLSLDHPLNPDPNDALQLANGSLGATVTVTDGDGDHVTSGAVDISSQFTFLDDGPSANNDTDSVGAVNDTATGNVITGSGTNEGTANADNPGADGFGSITNLVGFGGSTDSNPSGGFDVVGQYGTLHVDANGDYTYTRTGGPGGATDVFTYTYVDGDGDPASATLTITLGDATPTAGTVNATLDDDALAGGNPGGVGDNSPDTSNLTGSLPGSGGDAPLAFSVLLTGAPSGFTYVSGGAGIVLIQQNNVTKITVTVGSDGSYTIVQNAPIDHAAGGDENNQLFAVTYRVTDSDGDTADGTININVDDDTPTVSANAAVQLDDDALAGGIPGGTGDVNPDTANTSGTLAHSYGADGAGSMAYLTTGNPAGFTYELSGSSLLIKQGTTTVITLTLNTTTGAYTVTQNAPIMHPAGGDENDVSFTVSYQVTDHDGDTATGSITINVDDDTPTAAISATGQNVSIDESVGIQADSNDTTSASVIALFAGVTNTGTDTDLPQYATNALAIVSSSGSAYGADGAGTTVFSLNVSAAGVDSGLNTTDGHDILLFKEGNLIVGRVSGGADDGKAAFAIAIDQTGHISMVEYLSIQHPNAANPDDSVSITNGAVLAVVTVTDADSDPATQSVAIGNHLVFQDSGPVLTAVDNINIQNSGDVAATGGFHYLLGADGASADNNVFSVTGSATVNNVAVTNYVINETSENAATAVYSFSFNYDNGTGTPALETGTLTFNKAAGTYTVDLDNPIEGFSILATAGAPASAFINYDLGTSNTSNSPTEVATVQLDTNFFLQFSGVYDKTGSDHQSTTSGDTTYLNGSSTTSAGTATFGNLDLFSQANATVTISSSAAGVAGNTIQGGEVLDFNLYTTDHTGVLGGTPDQSATSMFIELDGVGGSEDMIIILKLYDTVTHQYSTEALMVQNGDIIVQATAGQLAGTPYAGITLDSNDGLIIVEQNDYQQGNTNLVIVGAQIAGSDDGIVGTAVNFNGTVGAGGGSSGTQAFSTDVSDAPCKIQNIGFLRQTTTDQNADLTFNVTVKDGDGDTVTQTIHATVTAAADSATAISLSAAVTTVVPVVLDLNGDGVHFLGTDAGVHYDYGSGLVATAWASPQDGILALDGNHNGTVDNASEFVFGGNGVTDLQALAAYDTNHDGQLSSADAAFSSFVVWQDANSNGVADAGEVNSLTALGITSISLSTDGISYTTANGDVSVSGTGSYTNADGSTGSLADAAFLTAAKSTTEDLKSSTSLASNAALIAAVAAAGLAAEGQATAAAHANVIASLAANGDAPAHNEALAPIALDSVSGGASNLMPTVSNDSAQDSAQSTASNASDAGQSSGLSVAGDAPSGQAPTELPQGTQAPAGGGADNASATAASIVMPSASQLAGANGVDGAQHNQVVGQVLADALHGGTGGNAIDALINSLPSHEGVNSATDALATHAGSAVPNVDMAALAGFISAHTGLMEQMVIHQVVAAPHA